ncbi:MAG: IclR family transcriptional regulator [Dermatophilus congolensis]|nr:IclR family transcriptional regulator [Dermatophilus congolensis]
MTAIAHVDSTESGASLQTTSVLKALHLLEVFRNGADRLGVSEIARRAGIPTSTAYRLLAHLVEARFVVKEGTLYRPGGRLFELGDRVADSSLEVLREKASPYLGDLYMRFGFTTRLGVLDGTDVIIVDKIVGLHSLPAPTPVGGRVAATCTALGKVLLAWQSGAVVAETLSSPLQRMTRHSVSNANVLHGQLLEARKTGLAYDREESGLGRVCVAAPIVSGRKVVAAISVSAPSHRAQLDKPARALLEAAARIGADLGRD